ncbi:extracellular solute-binding protein [Trichothermofontia sichuanensis B231]|uniref:extracellular solute-binding protein n=1 Tax=Trichothermofontia sichuanensis TaxID=3045816 RepID=UPI002246CF72|nr:extracellular solute-binding protein [Trichothermofontia sichuanensis]UZQ53580.1 extracellular solute-binding protein [Trichothermofontia sichuanensis B231]
MAQRSGPPPIVFILLFLILAGGGGYWFLFRQKPGAMPTTPNSGNSATVAPPVSPVPGSGNASNIFPPPTTVPAGTTVRIDGSTSMVTTNQNLKQGFESQFPGTRVITNAKGTNNGLQALAAGQIDIAAASRALNPQEQTQGLTAVPITVDAIALVIGVNNPFQGSLTSEQVQGIFTGKITNWSQVGGPNTMIRVINRPPVSGTHQAFKEMVLNGQEFGTTPNIATLPRDATTPMLQALGVDGIGYATYAQIATQRTVRPVPVNGVTPDSPSYPYQRTLYYVYKNPASPAVQAFLGYALSPQGQQIMIMGG